MIIRCVYVCVYVYLCWCVRPPPLLLLLAGVRWRAGHVRACQLAFCWSSHTVHNITISWWVRLRPVLTHALWSRARMSHDRLRLCQLQSTIFSSALSRTFVRLKPALSNMGSRIHADRNVSECVWVADEKREREAPLVMELGSVFYLYVRIFYFNVAAFLAVVVPQKSTYVRPAKKTVEMYLLFRVP